MVSCRLVLWSSKVGACLPSPLFRVLRRLTGSPVGAVRLSSRVSCLVLSRVPSSFVAGCRGLPSSSSRVPSSRVRAVLRAGVFLVAGRCRACGFPASVRGSPAVHVCRCLCFLVHWCVVTGSCWVGHGLGCVVLCLPCCASCSLFFPCVWVTIGTCLAVLWVKSSFCLLPSLFSSLVPCCAVLVPCFRA